MASTTTGTNGTTNDLELIARAQAGEQGAFDVMIERYRRFARARARGYFLVGADADDVEQEALIGLYKAVRDFEPSVGAPFRTFAELCITRQIITAINAATRLKHQALNRSVPIAVPNDDGPSAADFDALPASIEDEPSLRIEAGERMGELRTLLADRLSPFEAAALLMHAEGHSYRGIGEALGRPAKSVDNALQRIKAKLGPTLVTLADADGHDEAGILQPC